MCQTSGKASGPTVGSAGASGARRIGAAAAVATLWLALTVLVVPGLSATGMSREAAAAVIARTRQWVQGYMESLPNFTCRQTFRVFMGPVVKKPKLAKWAKKLPGWTKSQHRWKRQRVKPRTTGVRSIGRSSSASTSMRPLKPGHRKIHESEWLVRMVQGEGESYEWVGGSSEGFGRGYFAGWLTELFREELQTRFKWLETAELRGHGVHVFQAVTPKNFYRYSGQRDQEGV